jgi:hypothetical protein
MVGSWKKGVNILGYEYWKFLEARNLIGDFWESTCGQVHC